MLSQITHPQTINTSVLAVLINSPPANGVSAEASTFYFCKIKVVFFFLKSFMW